MPGRVEEKVALVTGASSDRGIGFATAMRLAEEGAIVYLTGLDEVRLSARAAEIGGRARALYLDVTSEIQWNCIIEEILSDEARIDILVNNAGIAMAHLLEELTTADFTKVLEVNLTSVFIGTQRAAMRALGNGGSIINISSTGGLIGISARSAYAASKGGLRLFSKSVAIETARDGIRVNTVHPGPIRTKLLDAVIIAISFHHEMIIANVPMGRIGEPVDVANCVLYLASDEARFVTGAEFVVDGGMTAQ